MPRPKPNPHTVDPRAWYGYGEHKQRALHQLKIEPMCRMCAAEGRITPAEVADHVTPVTDARGVASYERFKLGPLQSLCRACHDSDKRKAERVGFSGACDVTGWPTDPAHPWNVALRGVRNTAS
jgi:hypothetical protein